MTLPAIVWCVVFGSWCVGYAAWRMRAAWRLRITVRTNLQVRPPLIRRVIAVRGHPRSWLLTITVAVAMLITLLRSPGQHARPALACAFAEPPTTYETTEDRKLYLTAMDLAGHDLLFPNDPFFSQRTIDVGTRTSRRPDDNVYVPPTLLKAISWIESVTTQGSSTLPFGAIGPALVSFDCGYGIGQVTSGMTAPLGDASQPTDEQALVATHFAYNIARAAAILIDKWNAAPEGRPLVGVDTDSDPKILENWYYAVWSYNGFTGPGANRSNHPMDPVYGAWPRTPYSCGAAGDGLSHNRASFPYQEIVYGCMAHPPKIQNKPLWPALNATLPDLQNPYWRQPLQLSNFQYPYARMDLPTMKPAHTDSTTAPPASARDQVLGRPNLGVDQSIVLVNVRPGKSASPADVLITNRGTGIVPWRVSANKSWVTFSQLAGVAVGNDLTCLANSPCERSAVLHISVDPRKIVGSDAAVVTIKGLGENGRTQQIAVFIRVNVAIGIPGTSKN